MSNRTITTLDRDPVLVDPDSVRHTNGATVRRPWRLPDVPILVIKSGAHLYIVDGNHRFAADRQMGRPVKAWILTAKDRKKLHGTLTGHLSAWAEGRKTFAELRKSAVEAYKANATTGHTDEGRMAYTNPKPRGGHDHDTKRKTAADHR